MKIFRKILNPFVAFVGVQILWILVLVSWIHWFLGSHRRLRAIAEKYSPELLQGGVDWFILVEGIVLLVAILGGVYVIFIYWRRQVALYKAQRNFIAQVSHELKSPLASIQLHLETIRWRRPDPEKVDHFVTTMLADTERLRTLIENLLAASRMERRGIRLSLVPCDFSNFMTAFFDNHRGSVPAGGEIELDITSGIQIAADVESLETIFRNLLENAILYADGKPFIRVELFRDGNHAHLIFSDKGKGIERKDQKKVFQMFYRVRHMGETIKGSGLGLFIVRALVKLHRGKIWLESEGSGCGTTFHILFPLKTQGREF